MATQTRPILAEDAIAALARNIARALERAENEGLTDAGQKIAGNAYSVPSGSEADTTYFVVFRDRGVIPNVDVSCNCRAGLNGLVCKHAAVALVMHRRIRADGTILVRVN